jgi:hypothetical protein
MENDYFSNLIYDGMIQHMMSLGILQSDERLSVLKKNQGNQKFAEKLFQDAILNYNQALCFAETETCQSSLYGKRSEAYLKLKRYKESLQNIEWARKYENKADELEKLNKREKLCKKLMESDENKENVNEKMLSDFLKLSYESNEFIPFIIDGIEIKKTKNCARAKGLFATRDLNAGDIIAIEDPYLKMLKHDFYYKQCTTCLEHKNLNLLPCNQCKKGQYFLCFFMETHLKFILY